MWQQSLHTRNQRFFLIRLHLNSGSPAAPSVAAEAAAEQPSWKEKESEKASDTSLAREGEGEERNRRRRSRGEGEKTILDFCPLGWLCLVQRAPKSDKDVVFKQK